MICDLINLSQIRERLNLCYINDGDSVLHVCGPVVKNHIVILKRQGKSTKKKLQDVYM